MKSIIVIFSMFLFSGCVKTVKEKELTVKLSPADKKTLAKDCEEMTAHGSIMKLLKEIKSETREIIVLLDQEDLKNKQEKIEVLADSIEKKSKAVIRLSGEEWTVPKWDYEVKWQINQDDFNDVIGSHVKRGFQISGTKIYDLFLMGEKRIDLLENVALKRRGNEVTVSYKSRGSSLELCQLNKTMMLVMEVSYRNIANRNERFFNLSLK